MENNIEKIENYLEYFKHYFLNLSKFRKTRIKKLLIENQICPLKIDENGMPIDNTKTDVDNFVLDSFLSTDKAILLFQKNELFQNYKYSIFYKILNENLDDIKSNVLGKKDLFFDIDSEIEEFNIFKDNNATENAWNIKKTYYSINNEKIYLKIPLGIEKFIANFYGNVKTKMFFLCIIDLENKIMEVRYEGLTQPFKTNQEFYLSLEEKAVNFIKYELKLKLQNLDLQFIPKEIETLKNMGYKIVRRSAEFSDAGSAALGSNNENMLPYIDDLKIFLELKLKEFEEDTTEYKVASEMKREILEFFSEKEDESSYTNIILKINNYQTHFNYFYDDRCVVQHEYMSSNNDDGRGDYVKGIILQLERQFNKVGNERK